MNTSLALFEHSPRDAAIDALHAATAIYTAEPVVDALLDRVDWPNGDRRLVDPSCGDGVFLCRALERLLALEPQITPSRLESLVEGWEVHPSAAGEARQRITQTLLHAGWEPGAASATAAVIVRNADFLTEGPATGELYHVIAGNPPYLRQANIPELLRREYHAVVPEHARADMLYSFLDRCAGVLAPNGEIAFVTADRWLFNMGAAALRASLGSRLGIDHLERLDPASVFYRPKVRRAGTAPRIHPVAVILRAPDATSIPLGEAAIYPEADNLVQATHTLGKIATVRLAPWLGTPGIFVVDEKTAAGFPAQCLVPAVDTDDIANGELKTPTRYAIKTSADTEPPAVVLAHIDALLERMAPRGRRNPRWLPPESWNKLDLSKPSLLVPRIAKNLRPVRVPAGVLPINHNLSIVSSGTKSLDEIEAVLVSARVQDWVRARAARLENGYLSITTTLLRQLPVD